jgi:hypothetical protein
MFLKLFIIILLSNSNAIYLFFFSLSLFFCFFSSTNDSISKHFPKYTNRNRMISIQFKDRKGSIQTKNVDKNVIRLEVSYIFCSVLRFSI